MRTLELFSIDQILWAKVPTAVQAAGGSDPIQTPTETEKTLSITTLNANILDPLLWCLVKKDIKHTKYQKNSCGLSFRAE